MPFNLPVKNSYQNILVLCVYSILIFTLIFTTQTVFAGFQLTDDQILISFNNRLLREPFFFTLWESVKNEFYLRFRPLTVINYVAISKWLYPNFFLLALVIAVQGIFTCYFFYRFARQVKCSLAVSFLFPLFILCGNQGSVFWRNCVNETLGMLLLSISLFFLGRTFNRKRTYKQDTFLFIFFLLLATLTKESFIIIVPAILFFKVWYESSQNNLPFAAALKQNIKLVVFFSFVIIAEILIIYYYKSISDHFIQYVDIDQDTFNPGNLLISLYRLTVTKGYLLLIAPAMLFIFLRAALLPTWKKDVKNFILPLFILFLLIIIPQVLLYAKSLIFERYLLPGTLGSAVVIIFLEKYIQQHKKKLAPLHKVFLPVCALLLCLQIFLMTRGAKMYAAEGFEARNMLETIMHNTTIDDTVLVVANPLGQSDKALSVKRYLNAPIGGNRNNIFVEPIFDSVEVTDPVKNGVITNFADATKGIRYADISKETSIPCITFFAKSKETFFQRYNDIDTSQYRELRLGSFTVFLKK